MISAKGEIIYTNAEIAYELGLSPATVNAIGKRIWGYGHIPHYTLDDAKLIAEYVKSISVVEEAKRLAALHETLSAVMAGVELGTDAEMRKRVDNDVYLKGR